MATKKIQIEFDLNTNEVKLAGEATMSLAQQVRVLQKELSKTPEGTKEFELLRRKLNDTKDNFDRVNAKSRELFGTLSLLPGPVGDIAGKLNGAISLMKTFSGFSFKDIGNQFKGLLDDIKGILMALGSWGEGTKKLTNSTEQLTTSNDQLNSSLQQTNQGAIAAGAQLQKTLELQKGQIEVLKEQMRVTSDKLITEEMYQDLLRQEIDALEEIQDFEGLTPKEAQDLRELNKELKTSENYHKRYAVELQGLNNEITQLENQTKKLTAAQKAQNAAVAAGSNAWRIFKGIITAVGIGLLVAAVSELVIKLYDYVTGTKAAEEASKKFSDALQEENYWINKNSEEVKNANDERILQLRAQGASAAQIRAEETKQLEIEYNRQKDLTEKAFKAESDAVKGNNVEIMNAAIEEYRKRDAAFTKAAADLRKKRIQNLIDEKKELEDAEKEKKELAKKATAEKDQNDKEKIAKEKARLDAQIQLEIDSENTRRDKLEGLLEQRFLLEQQSAELSAAELELLHKEHQKKVKEALDADFEKRRTDKVNEYEVLAEIERNQQDIDVERLIQTLTLKRDYELQQIGLTEEAKKALTAKYENDFRKLRQDAREKELVESIDANKNNLDKQIQLYRDYGNEILKSNSYTEGEKLRIYEETNQKIQQLEQTRFEDQQNQLQLELGLDFEYQQAYYDKMSELYDQEAQRYKDLRDKQIITTEEYNEKMKGLTEARESLRQKELNSQMATLEAVGQALQAGAALVGESTRLGKSLAVAGATIDTYRAANQVLADPKIPTVIKAFSAAAIILRGLSNVRRIIATPIPNVEQSSGAQFSSGMINVNQRRAQGGFITGPGGETSDSVPAMLSNGEFVINSRSTRVFRPLLETINSASNLPQFAAGGLVRESMGSTPFKSQNETIAEAINTAFGQTPIKTYVTATDVSTQQQFERVIKSRSLI